jgi:hypothetical protein
MISTGRIRSALAVMVAGGLLSAAPQNAGAQSVAIASKTPGKVHLLPGAIHIVRRAGAEAQLRNVAPQNPKRQPERQRHGQGWSVRLPDAQGAEVLTRSNL